jgi:hypothetical protein
MRRFVLATVLGVLCSAGATAASVDQLSSRLKQYDDQNPAPRQSTSQPQSQPRSNSATYPEELTADPDYADPAWDGPAAGGCSDGCCSSCGGCGGCGCDGPLFPRRQFYGRAEALAWWVRGSNTPALVTTSPDNTPAGVAGVLPGATVLFGDQRINDQARAGGRFTLGAWMGGCNAFAIEDTFFYLGTTHQGFNGSSDVNGVLARPFFDTNSGAQDVILVALPGTTVGTIDITSKSTMLGNELNVRRALYADCCRRLDILAGYRFLQLNEGLAIDTNSTFTSSPPGSGIVVGTNILSTDSFLTRNQFNGGQLGFVTEYYNGPWTLELRAKIALGNVSQRVTIDGATLVTVPGGGETASHGGLLALPSNIGSFSRNQFGVLPEFNVNLQYQLNPCWKLNVGYTIFALTNVARPGDQIDTRVDANQIPPPQGTGPFTFPAFAFHNSDVLVQGINLGLVHDF